MTHAAPLGGRKAAPMQIYISNLAAYNRGTLKGAWIDVPTDVDALREAIAEAVPNVDDEYAVHDYDDFPDMGEHPSLGDLVAVATLVEKHGLEATEAALDYESGNVEHAADLLDEGFREFDAPEERALAEYAEELADEGVLSVETLLKYVDFERLGRDLGYDVRVVEHKGSTFIFN